MTLMDGYKYPEALRASPATVPFWNGVHRSAGIRFVPAAVPMQLKINMD